MAEQQTFKHIVRIAQVDVPGDKAIRIALTKIKGIGINVADILCTVAGIDKRHKAGNLSADDVEKLNNVIANPLSHGIPAWVCNRRKDYETGEDQHILTSTLNFVQDNDIKRLKKIKTLRGIRHQKKLPLRGQRTRSNFRRSKGKVIGVKKKAPAPAKKGK
ncbi:30S ribosomal protein S13 [Candidatus Woesearchaeota archaeon CG10_big_fil_rev_8_21_14_0_10_36_11]|nr:MAG: 30S ribosomal protein S13 [Candidatus Woesearchaeota archaeon CG10_big_fil_rev_8_21_14_0_10_36_11]